MIDTRQNARSGNQDTAAPNSSTNFLDRFRLAVLFVALVALLISPTLVNGFPFVMDDSIAYSGQGVNWMRSKSAAVAAAPLYRWIGYWGLPVLNSLAGASAWILLCRSFGIKRSAWLALPLSLLSLQPTYASAVIVDIWFFPAILFLIVAFRQSSPLLAIVSGILLSAHGTGLLLAVPFGLAAALVFRRAAYLVILGLAVGTTLVVTVALDSKYYPDMPRLGKTFVASRLFSVHPELLGRECERSGATTLCEAKIIVEQARAAPNGAERRDFFWDVAQALSPRFDLVAFEREHAGAIILDGLSWKPWETIKVVAADFFSFYTPGTWFDFRADLHEPMPDAYYHSLQYREGFMQKPEIAAAATASRFALYAVVISVLCWRWRHIDPASARWIALIILLCLANDVSFALLSGPPDRYHHRILALLATTAMIALADRPARKNTA